MQMKNKNALITGATSGIGFALASKLSQTHNLYLVANNKSRLLKTKNKLSNRNIEIKTYNSNSFPLFYVKKTVIRFL